MSRKQGVKGRGLRKVRVFRIFGKAALLWGTRNAPRLGAALAFYTVLSLAPLLIVAVGVMSLFLSRAEVQQGVLEQVALALGPESDQIVGVLRGLFANAFNAYKPSTGIITSVIGSAVLLFGASLVLVELRAAMNIIWGVEAANSRRESVLTFVKNRAISVLLVLVIGLALLATLTLNTYLRAGGDFLRDHRVSLALLGWLEAAGSFVFLTLFLALLYKFLPATRVRWRDVWFASTFAALLFSLGRWLLGAYLAESALGSAYGAAGSLVVFLLWVYYSAQLFFFGAALCRAVRDTRRSPVMVVRKAYVTEEVSEG